MSVEVLERGELSLSELAVEANREHELAEAAAANAVQHWINAGEALIKVKRQLRGSEWIPWLSANFNASANWGQFCVRLATYRHVVEEDGTTSIFEARTLIRGLPAIERGVEHHARREQALELRDAGHTYREIAETLGASLSTVQKWCNPKTRAKINARKREWAAAKRRMLAERNAKQAGGGIAALYAMSERMQDVIAQAQRETADAEARRALSQAGAHYRKMRDEIVRALGVAG
jgi:transposase